MRARLQVSQEAVVVTDSKDRVPGPDARQSDGRQAQGTLISDSFCRSSPETPGRVVRSSAEMAHTCLSVTEIHLSHLPRSDGDAMSADDWCCKRCHQSPGLQHGENCDPPRFAPPAARRAPLFPPDKPLPGLQHYLTASSGFREADDQSASWPTSPRSAALGKSTCLQCLVSFLRLWSRLRSQISSTSRSRRPSLTCAPSQRSSQTALLSC